MHMYRLAEIPAHLQPFFVKPPELGLEPTPELYVEHLVEIMREVRRVLRKDGTLWLNLGDSFASNWPCNRRSQIGAGSLENGKREVRPAPIRAGLKDKDLVGIPWRVAFALQAEGWYLRSDIIWDKPNAMPESVRDRPTRAHEYIFLLSKSAKYYYDRMVVAEPAQYARQHAGKATSWGMNRKHPNKKNAAKYAFAGENHTCLAGGMRNKRDVWHCPTKPYKGAHFATFPPDLIRPCILAGCPVGGVVADPFCGSGTTLAVAVEHGRVGIGIELNEAYIDLSVERIRASLAKARPLK